jgi:GT2 family glycosyltransferase
MPTISVIVPAYNAERTILETIKSVQQQSFTDFELIVINDGSSDRTLELLLAVEDSRLKIFSYENGGLPVARNRGISHAGGEFIAFLDADDLWTPDKLELQLAALQKHPKAGVAYSWTHFMDEQGGSFHAGEPILFEGDVYADLLVWNFIASGSNPLIRKQAIESVGEFDPTLRSCEDWDLWLRLAARWPFVVVPKPQILYRLSSTSMSSKIKVMEEAHLTTIERAFQSAPQEIQHLKHQILANVYRFLAHLCLTRVPNGVGAKQAAQKLQTAIRLYPQILLERKTQVLVVKLVLIRLLSPKIASNFLNLISKFRANKVQKYNEENVTGAEKSSVQVFLNQEH